MKLDNQAFRRGVDDALTLGPLRREWQSWHVTSKFLLIMATFSIAMFAWHVVAVAMQ